MTPTRTAKWTKQDVPDQHGRVAVVTGANSGIGYEAALVLAGRGATVVLACRQVDKGQEAAQRIHNATPGASVDVEALDLSSLASIRDFAKQLHSTHAAVDLLINNAGVMWTPPSRTDDGFELQFGTNHLGHFALTGQLLDLLLPVPGSRVVTVSSFGHRTGRIDFDDLQSERRYGRHQAYAQSKLANLMFTYELQRRLDGAGAGTIAVAAHPGTAHTNLVHNSPTVLRALNDRFSPLISQDAAMGALPTLRAATDPGVRGGEYYGPSGFMEQRGSPKVVRSIKRSHDTAAQRRLWDVSERLTGIAYPGGL
jgi:NAD(P)-dependent dehydrogenase (short-subunit alcohol dehydrogenase family)